MDRRQIIALTALLALAKAASAYIDPGTGGMIIGGMGGALYALLAGAFAVAVGVCYRFYDSIKAGVKAVWSRLSGRRSQ